jgi:hypothetical protein
LPLWEDDILSITTLNRYAFWCWTHHGSITFPQIWLQLKHFLLSSISSCGIRQLSPINFWAPTAVIRQFAFHDFKILRIFITANVKWKLYDSVVKSWTIHPDTGSYCNYNTVPSNTHMLWQTLYYHAWTELLFHRCCGPFCVISACATKSVPLYVLSSNNPFFSSQLYAFLNSYLSWRVLSCGSNISHLMQMSISLIKLQNYLLPC